MKLVNKTLLCLLSRVSLCNHQSSSSSFSTGWNLLKPFFFAGQYECRAVAGRQQISAVTEVRVVNYDEGNLCQERGQPEISLWRPTLMVEAGDSVVLPCRASRPDEAIVTWTDSRGEAVSSEAEKRFEVMENGDLRISEVSWEDMGQFTCTASNEAGVASVHTFLYPLASTSATHP